MPDPNLPLLEDAVSKLTPILDEIVFVGGAILGLLITDEAAAPICGTTDVDVIAEIIWRSDVGRHGSEQGSAWASRITRLMPGRNCGEAFARGPF